MALRSPAVWMGDPAVQTPASEDRLMLASLLRAEVGQTAANRPLTASSGVLAGPAGTMGEVTVLSNTQFTVNPARWWIQASASALGGVYLTTNDAVATLGITAQDATQSRRSQLGVWVQDKFVAGSGDNAPHWGLIDGPLAPSNPQLPAAGVLPANWLAVGEFLIPPTGQAVTWTPYDVRTGLRGGILPIAATDTRAGASAGQYRDHPTIGLQRWDGTAWRPVVYGQVRGKMWRTSGFSGTAATSTQYYVNTQVARLSGGFTWGGGDTTTGASSYLTIPYDGLYDIAAQTYLTGGATSTAATQINRHRASVADTLIAQGFYYKSSTVADQQAPFRWDGLPLLAGDQIAECLTIYTNSGATLAFYGTSETNGCWLSATYAGPLAGAIPV